MNNGSTDVGDDRELTQVLGTYWFDFEQAAELIDAAPAPRRAEHQADEGNQKPEEQPLDYSI